MCVCVCAAEVTDSINRRRHFLSLWRSSEQIGCHRNESPFSHSGILWGFDNVITHSILRALPPPSPSLSLFLWRVSYKPFSFQWSHDVNERKSNDSVVTQPWAERTHTHTHTHTVDCLFRTHLTKRNHSFCPSDQILALDFHACWRVVDPNLFPSLPIPLSNWYCRLYAQSLVFHYVIIFLLQLLGNGGGGG